MTETEKELDLSPEKLIEIISNGLEERYLNLRCEPDHNNTYEYCFGFENQTRETFSGPTIALFRLTDPTYKEPIFRHICVLQLVADKNVANGTTLTGRLILRKDNGSHWHAVLNEPDCFDKIYAPLDKYFGLERRKTP